jgi:hypothetical protein
MWRVDPCSRAIEVAKTCSRFSSGTAGGSAGFDAGAVRNSLFIAGPTLELRGFGGAELSTERHRTPTPGRYRRTSHCGGSLDVISEVLVSRSSTLSRGSGIGRKASVFSEGLGEHHCLRVLSPLAFTRRATSRLRGSFLILISELALEFPLCLGSDECPSVCRSLIAAGIECQAKARRLIASGPAPAPPMLN